MLQANAPSKLVLPFAASGAKNTIPVASQIGIVAGAASYTDGFPPLTRTPLAAGGVPPSGLDMNGALFTFTAIARWLNAGGGFVFDSGFATDTNVGGYPKGARIQRSDGEGYWINTSDNNTTDPESAGAAAAGWRPDATAGLASVAMSSSNVTLTPLQYGRPVIVITGTLTADLNLIFPAIPFRWSVVNQTTGSFTITCKTAAGSGVAVSGTESVTCDGVNISKASVSVTQPAQIQPVGASVAANALTVSLAATSLDFRNPTLTNGVPVSGVAVPSLNLTVPSGATLGTISGVASRLALLVAYNAGSPVLCVVNLAGGVQLDETNLISPTTISGSANSASVIYSAASVASNSPYRVVGFVDITQATAGTWVTSATQVQGAGGQAFAALSSLGYGQTWQDVTGSRALDTTYYNTTGRPILVFVSLGNTPPNTTAAMSIDGSNFVNFSTGGTAGVTTAPLYAIVPPGSSYRVASGAGTLAKWSELR